MPTLRVEDHDQVTFSSFDTVSEPHRTGKRLSRYDFAARFAKAAWNRFPPLFAAELPAIFLHRFVSMRAYMVDGAFDAQQLCGIIRQKSSNARLGIGFAGRNDMNTDATTYPIWQKTADTATVDVEDVLQMSDFALAQRSARSDMAAFDILYQRHHRRVYSLCLRMTQNVQEAEDLTQDAFIQLFRKIGSFRGDSAFTTWLHRLTVNQVLMHFRKRSVKMEKTSEEGEPPVQVVKGTENHRAMPVIDRIALDNAIKQLPPGYKSVFVLHDIEGHEHEQVARLLGCSVGTSKSQLHKARMKLRRLLTQKCPPQVATLK